MADTETLGRDNSDKKIDKKTDKKTDKKNKSIKSDFPSMCVELCKKINFKTAIFLFIIGTIIFSDVFIENCLTDSSYTDGAGTPTSKGTFIQMLVLIISFLCIDLLVQGNIL